MGTRGEVAVKPFISKLALIILIIIISSPWMVSNSVYGRITSQEKAPGGNQNPIAIPVPDNPPVYPGYSPMEPPPYPQPDQPPSGFRPNQPPMGIRQIPSGPPNYDPSLGYTYPYSYPPYPQEPGFGSYPSYYPGPDYPYNPDYEVPPLPGQPWDYYPPPTPSGTPPPEPYGSSPQQLYNEAMGYFNRGDYNQAAMKFEQLAYWYPTSDLADNAYYWAGEAYYAQKDYYRAIQSFQQVLDRYPNGNKVPDAYLKLSYAYAELRQYDKARTTLNEVIRRYGRIDRIRTKANKKLSEISRL
jgi:tol-pal system protein YbgF